MRFSLLLSACTAAFVVSHVFAQGITVPQNSMRGLYEWHNANVVRLPKHSPELYGRYSWRQIEGVKDTYDFSVIDHDVAIARSQGQRFAFRVYAADSGLGACVPDYLVSEMPNGTWFDDKRSRISGTPNTYFPDWNSPAFVNRAARLIAALGKRYDGSPDIAWVEIGLYGNWGEWHTSPYRYPSPGGAVAGADDVKRQIVDAYVGAFRHTRLIMMTDDNFGLLYALSKSPSIGIRRDSLGDPWFEDGLVRDPARLAAVQERWKTAPFVTEFFGFRTNVAGAADVLNMAIAQAKKYHVSMVLQNSGSQPDWAQMSQDAHNAEFRLADACGYNLAVTASAVQVGRQISIAASWTNSGSAPPYDPWRVTYVLTPEGGSADTCVDLGNSTLHLTSVMPNTDNKPLIWGDKFQISPNLPAGRYSIGLVICDPAHIRNPMQLQCLTKSGATLCSVDIHKGK